LSFDFFFITGNSVAKLQQQTNKNIKNLIQKYIFLFSTEQKVTGLVGL